MGILISKTPFPGVVIVSDGEPSVVPVEKTDDLFIKLHELTLAELSFEGKMRGLPKQVQEKMDHLFEMLKSCGEVEP